MENLETFILVAGSLAVACAFGWTATCRLILLVASGSKKINETGFPIFLLPHPLPAVAAAGHPAGLDDDIGVPRDDRCKTGLRVGAAVVIDLREWKYAAASRGRLWNGMRPMDSPSRA